MIVSLLAGMIFQSTGYYGTLLWFSITIAFFLVSSVKRKGLKIFFWAVLVEINDEPILFILSFATVYIYSLGPHFPIVA